MADMPTWEPPHYNPPSLNIEGININSFTPVEPLKPSQKIEYLEPLPFMCCNMGTIPTSYKEALSYEQQILWLCNYLETIVIPSLNQNANAVTELKNMFNQLMGYFILLQNYVNKTNKEFVDYLNNSLTSIVNFINETNNQMSDFINQTIDDMKKYIDDQFDALNVQDEINKKLDEMVSDGTMDLIINKQVLPQKLSRFIITPDMTTEQIQAILNYEYSKILEFQDGNYTINTQLTLNSNTVILLNNATITSNIVYTFTNFKPTDEFLEYNGNSNITIIGGKIIGGGICMCHCKNITIKDVIFEKCSGDHFIQIPAGNGIHITGCSFDGVPTNTEWYREYVQIDNMDFSGFPLFEENNPTYDNTPNKNWLVENCKFTNKISETDNNYTMKVGIGNHSSNIEDEVLHTNIHIKNCIFDGTTSSSIRTISMDKLIIENCSFNTEHINTEKNLPHIYQWYRIENSIIRNNNFKGCSFAISIETPKYLENIDIINNVFRNYTNLTKQFIVKCDGVGDLRINNNEFLDNTQTHIRIAAYDYNENINPMHNFEISNNLFHSLVQTNDIIYINQGNPTILENIFDIPDTSTNIALQNSNKIIRPFIRGNVLNVNKFYKVKGLDCKHIYDIPFTLFNGEILEASVLTPDYKFNDFQKITLICGYSNNIQIINLIPYTGNGFASQEETYSFFVPNNNPTGSNTPSYVSLVIDQNGNFRYNIGNTKYPIRRIVGLN